MKVFPFLLGIPSILDHCSKLKPGFTNMQPQNFLSKSVLVNITRYFMELVTDNDSCLCTAFKTHKWKRLALLRIRCDSGNDSSSILVTTRALFQTSICFSITSNKKQIWFFSKALAIHSQHKYFTCIQFNVALSHITHSQAFRFSPTETPQIKQRSIHVDSIRGLIAVLHHKFDAGFAKLTFSLY